MNLSIAAVYNDIYSGGNCRLTCCTACCNTMETPPAHAAAAVEWWVSDSAETEDLLVSLNLLTTMSEILHVYAGANIVLQVTDT